MEGVVKFFTSKIGSQGGVKGGGGTGAGGFLRRSSNSSNADAAGPATNTVQNKPEADKFEDSPTDWTAGVPSAPGRPVIELSNTPRILLGDDEGGGVGGVGDDGEGENSAVTDEINISWAVPQDDGGYPITGYRVEMLDLQSGCWIEVTLIEGYEPRCTLSNILYGIMYRFRVLAVNDAGSSMPGEASEPVVIDVPGVQIAPYFVQALQDTIALEHEKIEFHVRALGTPKPSLLWYKDDMEIFSSERIEMREEDEGGAVVLKGARLSDSGVIKCVAANILGRAVSTVQLVIETPPRLEVPENYMDGLIFRQDEVARIKIPLVAKPSPKVVWFFEDEPISSEGSADLHLETTDAYTSLRIQQAKRWHCGEFRVYVENENGEDAASVLVTVTSPPSPPGQPIVMDISETKCTLKWSMSEDDGGADIKHYVLEYYRDNWNVWLKATTTKQCQAHIDDLIPGSRYKFRVRAENVYGSSDPSDESDPFDVSGTAGAAERQSAAYAAAAAAAAAASADSETTSSHWPPSSSSPSSSTSPPSISVTHDGAGVGGGQRNLADITAEQLATLTGGVGAGDDDDDILDRFLKVKQYGDSRLPSFDSDGLPSIAPIDEDSNLSESEEFSYDDLDRTRQMFQDLRQISTEGSFGQDEDDEETTMPEELRNSAMRQQQPIPDVKVFDEDELATSKESLASLIPAEKKQAMNQFEVTLREMIQEAREMARTPIRDDDDDDEDAAAFAAAAANSAAAQTPPTRRTSSTSSLTARSRRKSPSVQSTSDSVVSVIEAAAPGGRADAMPTPAISVTADDGSRSSPKVPSAGLERKRYYETDLEDRMSSASPPPPPRRRRSRSRNREEAEEMAEARPASAIDSYGDERSRYEQMIYRTPQSQQGARTRSQSDVRGYQAGLRQQYQPEQEMTYQASQQYQPPRQRSASTQQLYQANQQQQQSQADQQLQQYQTQQQRSLSNQQLYQANELQQQSQANQQLDQPKQQSSLSNQQTFQANQQYQPQQQQSVSTQQLYQANHHQLSQVDQQPYQPQQQQSVSNQQLYQANQQQQTQAGQQLNQPSQQYQSQQQRSVSTQQLYQANQQQYQANQQLSQPKQQYQPQQQRSLSNQHLYQGNQQYHDIQLQSQSNQQLNMTRQPYQPNQQRSLSSQQLHQPTNEALRRRQQQQQQQPPYVDEYADTEEYELSRLNSTTNRRRTRTPSPTRFRSRPEANGTATRSARSSSANQGQFRDGSTRSGSANQHPLRDPVLNSPTSHLLTNRPLEIGIDPTRPDITSKSLLEATSGLSFALPIPRNIPHWILITYAYSAVLIAILLIANATPDGKLYIHFTALWSLILYFLLDDEQGPDLLESVVEGFVKRA